jgi:hypothetical protein
VSHPLHGEISSHKRENVAASTWPNNSGSRPVKLGKLNEGGALVHARGRTWGQLIFQDLFKKEQ